MPDPDVADPRAVERAQVDALPGAELLMLAAIGVALYLPVPRADSARGASPVYDPARPFRSLALILRYVLRPARTRINLENGTDGSRG